MYELYELYGSPAVLRGYMKKAQPKKLLTSKSDADVIRDIMTWGLPLAATEKEEFDRRLKRIIAILEPTFEPGICRFCHCTEDDPCYFQGEEVLAATPMEELVPCAWFDSAQTVCSHPRCIDRYKASKSKTRTQTRDEFLCGVALVIGSLTRDHNEIRLAQMLMRAHGVTREKLKAGGVDPYDLKHIPKDK